MIFVVSMMFHKEYVAQRTCQEKSNSCQIIYVFSCKKPKPYSYKRESTDEWEDPFFHCVFTSQVKERVGTSAIFVNVSVTVFVSAESGVKKESVPFL